MTTTTTTSAPDLAMALALLTTTYRDNVYRWNSGPVGVNLLLDSKRFPPVFRRLSLKCHPDRNDTNATDDPGREFALL